MSALFLHTSNRLVNLSAELAGSLAVPGSSPLEKRIVIVARLGIRRQLSLEIARIKGVCANVPNDTLIQSVGHLRS